ncbi:uncharacterized protein BDR25DRAFT_346014 [Lindgomyces ingoldianus]|uniref:Uncharacterized protein n=1 Tax=Lindgomyces ingoldianus TaxID=673940 RepID=A0ACB6QH31_9PLEO|nr:uncharacterized protein BDR25DRAFT_346014 [Lindgomyces ingoldianus]KAF2465455.1 hypothetical protein BDR25DRAFT_346014 [Lindgomyces ingoldianus]
MYTKAAFSILLALALTSTSRAASSAMVKNLCSTTVWITSIDSHGGPTTSLQPGQTWSEELHFDPVTGVAIKVTTTKNGLATGKPEIDFTYTLNQPEGMVYYDLSTVNKMDAPFTNGQLLVTTPSVDCPSISWPNSRQPPDDRTEACQITDILLTLCAPL